MRALTLADVPAILALQAACYAADYLEPPEAFAAKLQASAQTCWGVPDPQAAGSLLAYLVCLPVPSWHGPRLHATQWSAPQRAQALYLHDLALHPATRGQGVGQALVAQAEAWARGQGLRALSLMAVQGSTGYWARQGFQLWDQPSDPLDDDAQDRAQTIESYGDGACLMVKSLVA